jgi:hypothetical protein
MSHLPPQTVFRAALVKALELGADEVRFEGRDERCAFVFLKDGRAQESQRFPWLEHDQLLAAVRMLAGDKGRIELEIGGHPVTALVYFMTGGCRVRVKRGPRD